MNGSNFWVMPYSIIWQLICFINASQVPKKGISRDYVRRWSEQNLWGGIARQLGLGQNLRRGRGEERNNGRERISNLCSAFEALVAAVYLDQGLDTLRKVTLPLLEDRLGYVLDSGDFQDARTLLQEWS